MRGTGWSLRDMILAYVSTPDVTPSWLLPKSFFKLTINDTLGFMQRKSTHIDNWAKKFSYYTNPGSRGFVFWQHDMSIVPSLQLMLRMGLEADFPLLRPLADFTIKCVEDRTSDQSGWPSQWSTPYNTGNLDANSADWAALWNSYKPGKIVTGDSYQQGDLYYLSYTHACLVLAIDNGYTHLTPIEQRFRRWMEQTGGSRTTKWSLGL